MKLMGIAILGTTYSRTGIPNHKFKIPYSDKIFTSNSYSRYLKKAGKSDAEMLLDLNKLSQSDLPKCSICNTNHVRLIGHNPKNRKRVDIFDPVVDEICSNIDCIRSSKASKANYTAYENGNHASQNGKIMNNFSKELVIDGIRYHFRSNTELKFFKRFKNLLKNYKSEKSISKYEYEGKIRNYIPDYILKTDRNLPDIIEIKCGNIFNEFGKDVSQKNYLKFKSVIDLGYEILLIDYEFGSRKMRKYHLSDQNDLKILFKLQ